MEKKSSNLRGWLIGAGTVCGVCVAVVGFGVVADGIDKQHQTGELIRAAQAKKIVFDFRGSQYRVTCDGPNRANAVNVRVGPDGKSVVTGDRLFEQPIQLPPGTTCG